MRVRRRHTRALCTRPAVRARRPLTHLVTIDEGFKMFDLGITIGQRRGEDDTDFDKGYLEGFKVGRELGYEQGLTDALDGRDD